MVCSTLTRGADASDGVAVTRADIRESEHRRLERLVREQVSEAVVLELRVEAEVLGRQNIAVRVVASQTEHRGASCD